MHDELGNRMKQFYETRTRVFMPRRAYTIIRIDGKCFHSYTRGLDRPFDFDLISDMDATAIYLCKNIMGAKCAFVQSDEISILVTDFETIHTEAWFDNNIQKMASVSASMATRAFNEARVKRLGVINKWAEFDSRVFQIPSKSEVQNYFIWRQQDATRNSIASVAQSLYSTKQLNGKNVCEQQEMIFQKGQNWNDFHVGCKRGRIIVKELYNKDGVERSRWGSYDPPVFTENREYMANIIPNME